MFDFRFAVSSRTIADRIPSFAEKVRQDITEEIRGRLLCLKVDGVTKNTRHFVGINIQYIKEGRIIIRTLAVRELFSRHTGLNIRSEVLSTLDSFGISVLNLLTSTTDTGANMIKMAELLRKAQVEDTTDVGLTEWFPDCEIGANDAVLQTVKCAAHCLQLAVQDAVKDSDEAMAMLKKAREAACALRTPNQVNKLRKEGHSMPVLDVTTRWGSSFDMADSVFTLREYIVAYETDDHRLCLTDEDWDKLKEVIEALRPAREATTTLQGKLHGMVNYNTPSYTSSSRKDLDRTWYFYRSQLLNHDLRQFLIGGKSFIIIYFALSSLIYIYFALSF